MSAERRALVTGASQGLGAALATALAARGYRVTLVARDRAALEAHAKRLAGSGHSVLAVDLADRAQVGRVVDEVERGGYRVVINNAGAAQFGEFASLPADKVEALAQLNFVTPALVAQAFLRARPEHGTLVNVTSIVGSIVVPGNAAYCSAKAGLQALSECLWYEARARGVRVIDFRPVSLRTGFHRSAGGASMASDAVGGSADAAAVALVDAVESGRDFILNHGAAGRVLMGLRRLLPARLLLELMARRSRRAGYLAR